MDKRFDQNSDSIINCSDIIAKLEELSPRQYACEWDNVGLLVGRREKEVKRVMVALDATMEVVNKACESGCDMLITHHPMIFSAIKKVTDESIEGKKILMLVEHGISYYAMHTNFDTVGSMSRAVAELFLDLRDSIPLEKCDIPKEGMGRIANLPKDMTIDEICGYVKEHLELNHVAFYPATPNGNSISADKKFHQIAVMPGSGKSFIDSVAAMGCDLYLTGDMGYHDIQHAQELGISVIDATHDGLEKVFAGYISDILKCSFPLEDTKETDGEPKACEIPYWVIMQKVDNDYFNRNR